MGIIENGTISGTLPSKEVFMVHYPGYPRSVSRAVETLGGKEGIMLTRETNLNKLELRFRPEDASGHPALGERRPCNSFLLKISRKKSADDALPKGQNMNQSEVHHATSSEVASRSPDDPATLCADIVARVSESYHFDGMADYQHVIPIHADVAHQKKRKWMEVESLAVNRDLMDLADEDVMMLLPPFFAPKDIPENLVLRPPATSGQKKVEDVGPQNSFEVDIEPGFAIDFNVKEIPRKLNWKEFIEQDSEQFRWQVAVSELFDERPIWPRQSITHRLLAKGLKFSHHMLNRYLNRAAYYFSGGPFLRFWIKRGYDPRKDPESRVYQRMEFRVPPELRSYCEAGATNKSKPQWDDICAFKAFPLKCQSFLQLFELDDDYIQEEIKKPPKHTDCNYRTGWFSEAMIDTLRLCVAVRFISVFPDADVEDLLKSCTEEFERAKEICIRKDAARPSPVKQTNKVADDNEKFKSVDDDNGKFKSVADGKEGEFQIDEDEDDEDPDEYETLNMADDDEELPFMSHYLDMESNSRTYLQELFDGFPTGGASFHTANDSHAGEEEEYHIYEQDSDGVYSDDDNEDEDDDE